MKPADSSSPPRAMEKKNSMPSSAGESETRFEDFKRKTMNLTVEESFSKIPEVSSSIHVFSRQMYKYEKGTDVRDKLFKERLAELKKKEELVREREMNVELSEKELEEKRNFVLLKEKKFERKVGAKREIMESKEKKLEREIEVKRKCMELKDKELQERVEMREREVRDGVHTSEPEIGKAFEIVCIDETDEDDDADDEPFTCPDPDFNDFNNKMSSFAVGQVWALYDHIDAMPRYYAQILSILESEQSLGVKWLESENKEPTPIACGRFKYGNSSKKSHLMFSHEMIHITDITGRSETVTIFPRKGETWALFRDWAKTWNCNVDEHLPPYNYDYVEVVTEFDSDRGVGVAYLGKVEGFVSVYEHAARRGMLQWMIPSDEMTIFSHRVPSVKMNGDEKEGVPAGSFELDTAAIPLAYLNATKVEEE